MSTTLDPFGIVVSNRQRQKAEPVGDLFVKSVTQRLIHPIVVRKQDDQIVLVVGGRRLEALKRGNVSPLVENIHFRFFHNLSSLEAEIVELEENIKRMDLFWRDYVNTVGRLDKIFREQNPNNWDAGNTAEQLNLSKVQISNILRVHKNLDNPSLRDATSVKNAISILQISAERTVSQFVGKITDISRDLFKPQTPQIAPLVPQIVDNQKPNQGVTPAPGVGSPQHVNSPVGRQNENNIRPVAPNGDGNVVPVIPRFILIEDFTKWAEAYAGPKFNLIHCDFPFDIRYDSYAKSVTSTQEDYDFSGFWPLTDSLVENINNVCSYSAHIVFWFSLKFYQQTKTKLEKISDVYVHEHPFVWLKSDNAGIIPGRDNQFMRRIYETAFLCTRGKRPLVKSISNAYAAPTASNPVHPSQKPEPVLRFLFSGLVDPTTDFLDPTCGSGTALRAADSLDARTIVGIENNKTYADAAEGLCQSHRRLKNIRL